MDKDPQIPTAFPNYWANVAPLLTHLDPRLQYAMNEETFAALSQLSRLQHLVLDAEPRKERIDSEFESDSDDERYDYVYLPAQIELKLPELTFSF